MRRIIYSLLFLFIVVVAYAADIKGVVLEPDKSTAEYVTVVLKLQDATQNLTGTSTDLDGRFVISDVKKGSYVLEVSMIGYKTVTKKITITDENGVIDLKNIVLEEDSKLLDQVEVVAQASQMHFDIDKKVFDVDQNLASAGASASEVLEHIPSVTVDQDGEVSLRNSTNVEVWINGKPSGLDSDNRAQILQQMPAGSIEKVEIITNPSAKYSPEGTAGIINLVLKKDRKVGYYGSLEAGMGYQWKGSLEPRLSGNFNFNSSLVDFYINAGLRTHNMKGYGTTDRWTFTPNTNRTDTLTYLGQETIDKHGNNGVFVRTGVDFHLGKQKHDNLGVSAMFNYGKNNETSDVNYLFSDYQYNTLDKYVRNNYSNGGRITYNVGLDYQHQFDDRGSELRSSANFSQTSHDRNNLYHQSLIEGSASEYYQSQTSDMNRKRFEFKTDYVQYFGENAKLETGVAFDWQNNYSENNTYSDSLIVPEAIIDGNAFDYSEIITALYATYGQKWGNFSAQLGLRGEYVRSNAATKDYDVEAFTPSIRSYFQLYPTAYLSYSLPQGHEFQLNYTRRVNRPRGRQLSLYRNVSDSTNVSYGNPYLMPEFSNSLEFNYIKSWEGHVLSASLYYRYTTDIIQQVRFQSEENPNVMETTYENIAQSNNAGVELVSRNALAKWCNLTSTLNLFYNGMKPVYYKEKLLQDRQNNFAWNLRFMGNFMFTKTFSGQLSLSYMSPHVIAQGKSKGMFFSSIGLRKSFLDRKLNLSLSVFDLFRSMGWKNITWGDTFYQDFVRQPNGPMFNLSLSWNFGNSQRKTKRSNGDNSDGGYNYDDSGSYGE